MPRVKTPDGQIIEISVDELNQMLAPQDVPQDGGFGRGLWEGLSNMPADFISSFGGLKPLAQTAYNVVAGDRTEGFRGVADIAGGVAGTSAGAMAGGALGALGGVFAPVTVPLGASIGGYLGGTLGGIGTDYAVQALRGEETPTMEDLGYAFGGGLPYAIGGHVVAGANKKMLDSNKMSLADRLEASAIGARKSDFSKSVKEAGMGDLGEIKLSDAIRRVGESGVYKENIGDPIKLRSALREQMKTIGKQLDPEVARLEQLRQQQGLEVSPKWAEVNRQVETLRGTGELSDLETEALNRIYRLESELDLKTLEGLNQSRENLNQQVYGSGEKPQLKGLSDSLRQDVRTAQMEAAQQLDPNSSLQTLLRDYGDRADIVSKILNREITNEAGTVPTPRNWWKSTGGFGIPLGLIASGNPYAGFGLMGLSAMYETPTGQLMLADILRNNKMSGIPGALQQGFIPTQQANILMREDQ